FEVSVHSEVLLIMLQKVFRTLQVVIDRLACDIKFFRNFTECKILEIIKFDVPSLFIRKQRIVEVIEMVHPHGAFEFFSHYTSSPPASSNSSAFDIISANSP